jgi:hypothetical protein
LGFGKTEIFLQTGLDKRFTDLLADLPVRQSADLRAVAGSAAQVE